ncbi:MAG: phytanoyl-CoA dioxygenase family protein [Novosphingobium sp.]
MMAGVISDPGTRPLKAEDVHPVQGLQSCNHLLDDHAALMRFHDEEGYIFLRDVLSHEALDQARREMFAIMEGFGLIEPGATEPVWTGKPFPGGMEESPIYSGISRRLVEHPDNLAVMEKILGEPAMMVPIVQYRNYPPGGSITGPHQDGFFAQGVQSYKPAWMPITRCEREVGGLAIAVRQCNRGYLHDAAATPPLIPDDVIPADAWATDDYFPGDVLVLNPFTPHCSLPNTSDRCRVTIDTRVQSAADPRVLVGNVVEARSDAIVLQMPDGEQRSFPVDQDTFIRIESPGVRESIDNYVEKTRVGAKVLVIIDENSRAQTLRRAAEG